MTIEELKERFYDFTVSEWDDNYRQYISGMFERERLNAHGLRFGNGFTIYNDYRKNTAEIWTMHWRRGVPHLDERVKILKDEIVHPVEVDRVLRDCGII